MGGRASKASPSRTTEAQQTKSTLASRASSPRRTISLQKLAKHERLQKHIKTWAILDKSYNWDALGVDEIVEIFTKLLAKDKAKLIQAWTSWRPQPLEWSIEDKATSWNPAMYKDKRSFVYASYFPCVINKIAHNPIVGFDANLWKWFGMPQLDFLPSDVNDIVAGDGGLLCINGGLQPSVSNYRTPPTPHSQDYNHVLYPPQSILLVCNPLTKKIKYIPPHSNKTLDAKIALMVTTTTSPPSCGKKNPTLLQKQRYQLYVVGSHCENATPFAKGCHELVFMAYDSRPNMWVSRSIIGQCRFPKSGKTSIAVIDEGYITSGQERTCKAAHNYKATISTWKELDGASMESKPHKNMPIVEENPTWKNMLFFVHKPTLKWHKIDFDVVDSRGVPRKHLQAPRILQCAPQGKVYAITRSVMDPCTIEVYEVLVSNGLPSGEYGLVTTMPTEIYRALFKDVKTKRLYDCCACLTFLCFLIPKDISTATTVAIYDITTKLWSTTLTPNLSNQCGHCTYSFAKCEWVPDWQACP